jgi:hypothetical protein
MPSGTWQAYLVWKIKGNAAQITLHAYLFTSVADPDPSDPYVLGLLNSDLDPLVRGMDPDPDPSTIKQK